MSAESVIITYNEKFIHIYIYTIYIYIHHISMFTIYMYIYIYACWMLISVTGLIKGH